MAKRTHLIIRASCGDEFADPQPTHVIFLITRKDVQGLLTKIERVKRFKAEEDQAIYRFSFWDGRPTWLSSLPWEEKERDAWPVDRITGRNLADLVDDGNTHFALVEVDLPEDDLENHTVRSDCVLLGVSQDSVDWRGCIRNTDFHISTRDLHLDDLQKILKTLSTRKAA